MVNNLQKKLSISKAEVQNSWKAIGSMGLGEEKEEERGKMKLTEVKVCVCACVYVFMCVVWDRWRERKGERKRETDEETFEM